MNINEIPVELITDMLFAKYRTQVTYQGKTEQQLEWGRRWVMANAKTLYLPIPA